MKALNNSKPTNTGRHLFTAPPILTASRESGAQLWVLMSLFATAARFRGLQIGMIADPSAQAHLTAKQRERLQELNAPPFLLTIGTKS